MPYRYPSPKSLSLSGIRNKVFVGAEVLSSLTAPLILRSAGILIVISSDLFVRDPDITGPLAYVTRQRVCQDGSMSGRV